MKRHIIKKGWIIFGMIILLWTAFWFIKIKILNQSDVVLDIILFTVGYCLLINYILITIVYWVIKRLKKQWEIRG